MRRTTSIGRSLALALATALGSVALVSDAQAQSVLGTAQTFGVLGASTVTNTGPSVIDGDVGVYAGSAITGFPPGSVVPPYALHVTDAVAQQAQSDNTIAYNALRAAPVTSNLSGVDLGGQVLIPGVYAFDSSAMLTGNLTLDAQNDPGATWIFVIGSELTTASASSVSFINGNVAANGGNVFWLVGSSATLGSTTSFTGNILALTSIALNTGAIITCGRALAQTGAVTLDTNTIIIPGEGGCLATTPTLPPEVIAIVDLTDNLEELLAGGGLTGNQTEVAQSIFDAIFTNPSNPVLIALGTLSLSELAAALNAISGEGVTGAQQTAFGASNLFMSAVMGQVTFWRDNLGRGRVAPTPPPGPLKLGPADEAIGGVIDDRPGTWRVWAAGFGGRFSLDGNARTGSADLDSPTAGLASGIDYQITRSTLVGIAGGYSDSDFSVNERRTSGTVEGPHVGLYGLQRVGPVYFAGIVEYASFDNDTKRNIVLGGSIPTERATGKFDSETLSGRIEAGWELAVGRLNVTPFAGMQWSRLDSDGFTENTTTGAGGQGIFGLQYGSREETSRVSSLGVQFDTAIALSNGMMLSPFVRVAWLHEFNPERSIFATMVALPDASFAITGASAAEDAARVNAGLKLDVSERVALFGFFEGDFSDLGESYAGFGGGEVGFGQGQHYAGRVGMRVAW